jgi:hypothetical protein
MIAIDNSVELMIRTFLSLPKRINGLSISKREYNEIGEGFIDQRNALERYASSRLGLINVSV